MKKNGISGDDFEYVETKDKSVVFKDINIKQGKTVTLEYEVRANRNISDNTQTYCQISATYNDNTIQNTIKHNLRTANIISELKAAQREQGEIKLGYNYEYILSVSNNSDTVQNDVKVNLNVNDLLKIVSIYYNYGNSIVNYYDNEQINTEFTIERIEQGETINILIGTLAQNVTEDLKQAEISAIVTSNDETQHRSNKIIEKVKAVEINLGITSTTDSTSGENYVVSGDTIKYTITVENTGKVDAENLIIKNKIINYLTIKSAKLDGKAVDYITETYFENDVSYSIINVDAPLKSGEKCTIEITTLVNEISSTEILKVTNSVSAYNYIYLTEENGNTYYIKNKSTIVEVSESEIEANEKNNSNFESDVKESYIITGTVWYDKDRNGSRIEEEEIVSGINVHLLDVNSNAITATVQTDEDGFYTFTDIPSGEYMVAFEYDTEEYMPTIYQAENVAKSKNSDAIKGTANINDEEKIVAITDVLKLNNNLSNIDLGLVEAEIFDLELNKYVTKIVVTNNNGTKTYEFDKSTLAKVEIAAKELESSKVLIEYTVEIKNAGELAGYVQNIVDYKSTDLSFSSSLNTDWYQSGNYVYNDSLVGTKIEPGETKELKLILSKEMTKSNTGLVNNTAEIYKAYNTLGVTDIDSTPGNNVDGEDDLGSADAIIGVKTGTAITYIALTISILIVLASGAYLINKKVLNKLI